MNYLDKTGTLIEGFEAVEDWILTGTGASIAADTTNYKTGSQGIRVTSVNNVSAFITKTISRVFSEDIFTLWFYVDDISKYSQSTTSLIILSSTTDFSKSMTASIHINNAMSNGWNKIIFNKSDFTAAGEEDWVNTMIRLRFRVLSKAGETVNVTLDEFRMGEYRRPKCILTFDDGHGSVYDEAYATMRRFGFKGVAYVPGDAAHIGNETYMTLANLTEMYNYGWDISNHSLNHVNLTTLATQAEVEAEISGGENFLVQNGYTRYNMQKHFAIPQSTYNTMVLAALTAQGVLTARCGVDKIQPNFTQDNLLLRRVSVADTTTLSQLKAKVDEAIAKGGAAIFNFHRLVASPSESTEWAISDYQDLMEYLYQKLSQIDVVTLTEWYWGLNEPRKLLI